MLRISFELGGREFEFFDQPMKGGGSRPRFGRSEMEFLLRHQAGIPSRLRHFNFRTRCWVNEAGKGACLVWSECYQEWCLCWAGFEEDAILPEEDE